MAPVSDVRFPPHLVSEMIKKNRNKTLLKNVKSSLLGDKRRNEGAVNSTRSKVSSLKVFQVLLCQRSSIPQDICFLYRVRWFASELIEYRCEIHENQAHRFERNYIIAKKQ